jgi:hypothetical protein
MNTYNKSKYPFTDNEIGLLDDAWKVINIFNKKFIFLSDYRNYIINHISSSYTPETFLRIESIINKLFWNIRWSVYPQWSDDSNNSNNSNDTNNTNNTNDTQIPSSLTLCEEIRYLDSSDLKSKLMMLQKMNAGRYYRSFVNKLFIVDKQKKIIYVKSMEHSSELFSKNYFNLLTSHIMYDRQLYERIIGNPSLIRTTDIPISEYYYQPDYGFPNLNCCEYLIGTDVDRLDRIKKLLFSPDDKYWFKIIV